MPHVAINHPHAQTALLLASFNQPDRPWVSRMLAVSGTPRRLYTLARVLRAAQAMDEIDAMHQAIFLDFNGDNHAQLAERYGISVDAVYRSVKASGHAARLARSRAAPYQSRPSDRSDQAAPETHWVSANHVPAHAHTQPAALSENPLRSAQAQGFSVPTPAQQHLRAAC